MVTQAERRFKHAQPAANAAQPLALMCAARATAAGNVPVHGRGHLDYSMAHTEIRARIPEQSRAQSGGFR